ncbi:hypothetical protein WEI85_29730 [Actinomycetes bacterium KLBMP 9797]
MTAPTSDIPRMWQAHRDRCFRLDDASLRSLIITALVAGSRSSIDRRISVVAAVAALAQPQQARV